ncbi:MAG: hypothetical protein ACXAE3_01240, partial [Candidatus Kariarchaeaceae archaeon]
MSSDVTPENCYDCIKMEQAKIESANRQAIEKVRNEVYLNSMYTNLCILQPQKRRNRSSRNSYLSKYVLS